MSKIQNWALSKIAKHQSKEEGQGLAEYGLILALIAVVCVVALGTLQTAISGSLTTVAGKL